MRARVLQLSLDPGAVVNAGDGRKGAATAFLKKERLGLCAAVCLAFQPYETTLPTQEDHLGSI